jgi:hypothetical protein
MKAARRMLLLATVVTFVSIVTHRLWNGSPANAGGPGSYAADGALEPAPPWATEGFRDADRCEMFSDPPECH